MGDTFGFVGETARHFFPTMLRVNFLYLLVVAVMAYVAFSSGYADVDFLYKMHGTIGWWDWDEMGMGMLGVAVVFFLLAAAAVLALTKLHFGAMPENAKVLRITVPEDVDYETALPDVFRAHHVTATLEKVRTESMGTLFELTYQVNLPSAVPSKALLDDLRERNGNLPILFTNPGDNDSL